MRHRRAHEGDLQHAGEPDVRDVFALAPQETPVFLSRKAGADPLLRHAAFARGGRIEASDS